MNTELLRGYLLETIGFHVLTFVLPYLDINDLRTLSITDKSISKALRPIYSDGWLLAYFGVSLKMIQYVAIRDSNIDFVDALIDLDSKMYHPYSFLTSGCADIIHHVVSSYNKILVEFCTATNHKNPLVPIISWEHRVDLIREIIDQCAELDHGKFAIIYFFAGRITDKQTAFRVTHDIAPYRIFKQDA